MDTTTERTLSATVTLSALAEFLNGRWEAVLERWEKRARARSSVAVTLSTNHLRDLMPQVLESFERRLRALPETLKEDTLEHGSHRWQQGYSLREVMEEWSYLQRYVMEELEDFRRAHPTADPDALFLARQTWMSVCDQGVADSAERYSELQKAEATGVLQDLQQAVAEMKELELQRATVWHEAAHDLRGNVGLVTSTAAILTEEEAPDGLRTKAMTILQRSVFSLHGLLEDLMSLARLEAGREQRNLERFDAAAMLRGLALSLEPMAHQRGLSLTADGPDSLWVEGDPAKVLRIVQNLALNALKYTHSGGVTVSWSETWERDTDRWLIRVRDTGPGIPGSPIAGKLREATVGAVEAEERDSSQGVEPAPEQGSAEGARTPVQRPGEGIGLSIVKRLCELLDAGLELASGAEGSLFQVVLPRRYIPTLPEEPDEEVLGERK
jgi:signal transduction histidine kinase